MKIYNHISPKLSDREWEMAKYIPPGGNWQNIPEHIPSKRLEGIRKTGGRTTYYGRLRYDKPSFTITTYFNRLGNSSNLHPEQQRMISTREAARLQSFPDDFIFYGPKSSHYKQIGNAVPPILARAVSSVIKPHISVNTFVDLFSGAGGMSEGFIMNGFTLKVVNEIEKNFIETNKRNHQKYADEGCFINGNITEEEVKKEIVSKAGNEKLGLVIGGPPCQGFSYAGWRDPNDDRNQLFTDFVDIVNRLKPEAFVMENVPGILTMRKGEAIKEIIECFREIGYNVMEPMRLSAEHYGVPQKRKRVFIVGFKNPNITISSPEKLFSEEDDMFLPNPITVEQAIKGLPVLESNDGAFELELPKDYKPLNSYQKLLNRDITFEEFYKDCTKKS